MNMSKKCQAVNVLIMNVPIALAISLAAQLIATGTVVPRLLLINFCLAYVISFLVGMFLPAVPWGLKFAGKCKAQPETLKFGLLVNVIVNLVYVVVNCLFLTYFNVVMLGHQPIKIYFIAMLTTFIPIYLVGYVVSFLWNRPAEKIARNICNE
ncbi:MAG: hypothetical protein IJR96_08370 [Pseudobutyrivibrio sp.]|nr:hypothetical protein [Pseudobutyrivibrio sp.]